MDYCRPCRRHLNGAVSCPGCGAYAGVEEYAFPAAEAAAVDYGGDRGDRGDVVRSAGGSAGAGAGGGADEGADGEAFTDPVAASTRADRRKASRRNSKPRGVVGGRARRARRGRGRRVTIMASVLGPVLAGLFVAEIATEGGVFREPSTTSSPYSPDKSEADRSPGEGDSSGPRVRKSRAPGPGPTGLSAGADGPSADGGRREDGASDKGGKKSKDSASPSADGPSSTDAPDVPSATAPAPATGGGGEGGGGGAAPSPSTPDPGTTTSSVPTRPTSSPLPSQTCDRLVRWCT